jgi:tripartite-type tricarboxylate transporter receptor subunit TctC
MTSLLRYALVALACCALAGRAQAQEFPSRQITLIVPLAAGGAMDIVARGLAQKLSDRLKQPVVVENRVGGGTVVAATSLAKAEPNGYTLMFTPSATLTTNIGVYKQLPYDPAKDFAPVALTSQVGFVLVVNPSLPVQSVADLIKVAKERPGQMFFGSPGNATMPHLAGEIFKRAAGIQITHTPYRGSMPALNDVVAGHIQMTFTDPAISAPLVAEGKLRAIGVSSRSRVSAMPQVAPLAELGVKDFDAVSWHMIMARAGTPQDILDKLHGEFKAVGALPEVKEQIIRIGLIPIDSPPRAALKTYLDSEIQRWNQVVRDVGLVGSQ